LSATRILARNPLRGKKLVGVDMAREAAVPMWEIISVLVGIVNLRHDLA
jgi:hypothetical protein